MHAVSCRACAARVLVKKFSPAHTQVQWTETTDVCHELRGHELRGTVLTCHELRGSIDDSVRAGHVPVPGP